MKRKTPWLVSLALVVAATAAAQERHFLGPYVGAELGRQNIIAGSLVDGVDVLQQENRTVFTAFGGYRYQLGFGLVLGAELGLGWFDGSLSFDDDASDLRVLYEGGSQWTLGGNVGYAFGPDQSWLVYGYVSEATRDFDVLVEQGGGSFEQSDEQGMLRYGVGVEKALTELLHVRGSLGSGRADFGEVVTNIDPERQLELSFGVVLQF